MWEKDEHRLAVLELYETGRLRRREGQREAWTWLSELPWTRVTRRRNVLAVVDTHRNDLEAVLDNRWPAWRETLEKLREAGAEVTHEAWSNLQDEERAGAKGTLPARLNAKTATAQVGPHSKARLTPSRRGALSKIEITRDGIVRLRPNEGLVLARGNVRVDASTLEAIGGEVMLSERALIDGTRLIGTSPIAVLLVENLGPYLDIEAPEGWMVVHVPGWNTATVKRVLEQLADVAIIHFGDLDPEGVRIAFHLRKAHPELHWLVPDFWREYVQDRAQTTQWPTDLVLDDAPELIEELRTAGKWMEQETIVLDSRLIKALQACC